MNDKPVLNRREVIQRTAAVGVGVIASVPGGVFAADPSGQRVQSRGYAAFDATGELRPWSFERQPVGDYDILIDIRYASICHSDIHQMKGHWGAQQYPQVPGHEIAGVVKAVGSKVSRFKPGDRVGVGCMVDGNPACASFQQGEEQYCPDTVFTYGYPQEDSPTGISQGGYANNIVVNEHFAVHIPPGIELAEAAPLLCAGITTYSPLMKFDLQPGDRVGVAGIGGLGHLAIKLAVAKGAEVYAFTTSPDKVEDIRGFGAKQVVIVDEPQRLAEFGPRLDYMISTIPVDYDIAAYASTVKPTGYFTQVGMPENFAMTLNGLALSVSRVNFNVSLIGGMRETQEVVDYCVSEGLRPEIQIIKAADINKAWEQVVRKQARYRFVIDAATI
ncbi:MAG: NAD(P)-dependent alcohol dehydrogenase [Abyssibacter sp.]|uniref:NAD(P)-dependent alcohol dehydrogenase n=1 Tax=Abyssibacter sp. TaxID=2320200 RepID=UPI00321A3D0D